MAVKNNDQTLVDSLHSKVSHFDKKRLKPLEKDVEKLKDEMEKLKGEIERLTHEMSQFKEELSTSTPSRDDGRAAELEKALKEKRAEIKRLTRENEEALKEKQSEIERMTRENKAALEEKQGEIERLTRESEEALKEKQREIKRLTDENADLRAQLKPFEGLLDIYARYSALELLKANDEWREILPTDTPTHFLLRGSQSNTITSFWKKLRNCCESPGMADSPEWKVLLDVLRFLLEQYNSTLDTPVWEWMEDRAGERFDDERHMRDKSGSQYSGNIAKVLLPGIWNRGGNRAAQKCVVVVATEGGMP